MRFHGYHLLNMRSGSGLLSGMLTSKLGTLRMQGVGSTGLKLTHLMLAAKDPRKRLHERRVSWTCESACRGR